MRLTSSHLLLCLLLLVGAGIPWQAQADITMAVRQVDYPGVRLRGVDARLGDDPAGGLHLSLTAAQADIAALGWRRLGLQVDGRLRRDARSRWIFNGSLRMQGAPGGALGRGELGMVVSPGSDTLQIELRQDQAVASVWVPLDQTSHAQISLRQVPLAWLQGLISTVWSGRLIGGVVTADLALDHGGGTLQSSGQFQLAGAGFDTPAGNLAGQGVGSQGRFDFADRDGTASINVQGTLSGGELLLGPLFARLPAHAVQLALQVQARRGAITVQRLRYADADAMQLDGSLAFDADGRLRSLEFDQFKASLPAACHRYGAAWLASLGLRNVQAAGQLEGSLDWRDGIPRSFAFHTAGLDFADADGRFGVAGLHGGLDWSAQGDRAATELDWNSLQFHRIALGAAHSRWQSRGGTLSLLHALNVPVLKGQLRIANLDWNPAAVRGQRLATSATLSNVDMAGFSHALGWPAFPGTLGGAMPSLRWVDGRFVLDGGLSMNVFGGFIDVTGLTVQHPFGDVPVLTGNISLQQLDLGAITSVFDFGSITGHLSGSVDGLQLVNWNPVAFKASLLADEGGRISQRAVNNLTAVGGGGIAGGLQGAMLKLFKTFGYQRIGLNCTLQGTVCTMSGLGSEDGGYTIVEGRGLPRLQVIGHQSRVDWPTLVRRLREAVNGQAPVVR